MPLGEHLAELRARLVRALIAVAAAAGLGWWQAEAIHGWLMQPVLRALPPGSEALVYTSAVEELNVLLRVGLYAGFVLATPVILRELWGFVAPGLHASERRLAWPFVAGGTLAFLAGSLFCHAAMLPPMFGFLLRDGGQLAREERLALFELREQRALTALRAGDGDRCADESRSALAEWSERERPGRMARAVRAGDGRRAALARLGALGRVLDAAGERVPDGAAAAARSEHDAGLEAWRAGDSAGVERACVRSVRLLAAEAQALAPGLEAMWELESALADARAEVEALRWTRPMLSVVQQLDLVVLLMLATGAIFELPLVLALLGLVGWVSTATLMRFQRHVLVACVIAAAFITPTSDVFNLALMAAPMLVCFELGVLAVWVIEHWHARREPGTT